MSNIDSYSAMDDEAFEAMLESGGLESHQEAPSEPSDVSDTEVEQSTEDEVNSPEEATEEQPEDVEDEAETEESEDEESVEEESEEQENPEDSEAAEVDSKFEPITIKASGQTIEVRSEEERNRLMQMGFDYSAKMQGMKTHRKTIKTLEQNEIDEEALNLLISAHKGDKGAIAKLVQDHKIDTMDLDGEDSGYTPTNHSVSDSQVELDDVISRIQETPSFSRTSDLVTNQWDAASKKVVFDKPEMLETLNSHIANGTYDRVMQEVNRAKVFGGLQGLSDLEAYQKVGMELQNSGAFGQAPQQQQPASTVSTKPKAKKPQNTDKKLRASSTRKTPAKKSTPKYDYGKMSDAEFEKLLNPS